MSSSAAFQSTISDRLPIIDDDNYLEFIDPDVDGQRVCKGRIPRDYSVEPIGSLGFASPFRAVDLIPRDQWTERIKDREKQRQRIDHICDQKGSKVKNQSSTNYCWINAPVRAFEVARVASGQKAVSLSPASAGAIIKGFRNVGGWGTEGTRWIAEHGLVPSSMWPDNAIDRRYNTEANNAERAKYKVTEWTELRPRDFDAMASLLLVGVPVAIGLNWWGHEVLAIELLKRDGTDQYVVLIDNSWGSNWGDNGRGILTMQKATPDDAIAPRVVTGG